ncbi:sulfate adenylyltransferase subunit 1 [Pectinatus frisingensis]|uniref:sulfate adenylyltransferase subunit 1 n=1 Tax=Pectinatus frisingensis TaxID=865 RepID=UPI0018C5DE75|nr:GTP-binding protein [Pectinatus frisingensis]
MSGLLKFITCGSVDDGKSTLIGHILYDAKLLYADQEKTLELESQAGSRGGKLDYALLLDGLLAEHEQGITIDVAYRYFTTNHRSFIVADTPGHEEYTRNMAVGASFAELAVILVDAAKGVLVQTRRHARICHLMGIKYFIFAVNKMDIIDYDETKFKKILQQINELVTQIGLNNVTIIPLSATEGDNVTTKSTNMPWYNGQPLLGKLENIKINETVSADFYMPVQRVCRPDQTFRGFQGQCESGELHDGDQVTIMPSGETATVRAIYNAGTLTDHTVAGQAVTIALSREVDISRGCIISKNLSASPTKLLTADILWMDDEPLQLNHEYVFQLGTSTTIAVIKQINYQTDVNDGSQQSVSLLNKNELASCDILLSNKTVAALFTVYPALGSFILVDRLSNMTAACGIIKNLQTADSVNYNFIYNDIKISADLFDEYYYNMRDMKIARTTKERAVFTLDDELPLRGKTYNYPSAVDIIALPERAAIQVRHNKIKTILPIDRYSYDELYNVPLLDSRGFAINVHSQYDFNRFYSEYQINKKSADFWNKWIDCTKWRHILFNDNYWII